MVFTELLPSFTLTRWASPSGISLNRPMVPSSWPSAWRQLAFEGDVDADGAIQRGRVDTRDAAHDDSVAGIHLGDLSDRDVLGLRFRDAQFGFEQRRVGHARQVGARSDGLTDFHRHELE